MAVVPFSQCGSRGVLHAFARPRANRRMNEVTPIHAKVFDHNDVANAREVLRALSSAQVSAWRPAGVDALQCNGYEYPHR